MRPFFQPSTKPAPFLLVAAASCSAAAAAGFRQEEAAAAGRAHLRCSQDRSEIEPDNGWRPVPVVLPAPVVNDSWPQSGGFANYAMQHLAVGDSPQIDLDGRCRRRQRARAAS